jgi:hypothetical protein
MPVEIGTVMEAYALLDDWPPSQRNPAHTTALNACKAALARRNDLLVEDGAVAAANPSVVRATLV